MENMALAKGQYIENVMTDEGTGNRGEAGGTRRGEGNSK